MLLHLTRVSSRKSGAKAQLLSLLLVMPLHRYYASVTLFRIRIAYLGLLSRWFTEVSLVLANYAQKGSICVRCIDNSRTKCTRQSRSCTTHHQKHLGSRHGPQGTIFLRRFICSLQVFRRIRKNIYLDSPRRVLTRPALCQFLDYGWGRLALEIGTSALKSMHVDLVLDSYDPFKNF
jgi:hypothetical protein